jgi:hypothetical protein
MGPGLVGVQRHRCLTFHDQHYNGMSLLQSMAVVAVEAVAAVLLQQQGGNLFCLSQTNKRLLRGFVINSSLICQRREVRSMKQCVHLLWLVVNDSFMALMECHLIVGLLGSPVDMAHFVLTVSSISRSDCQPVARSFSGL